MGRQRAIFLIQSPVCLASKLCSVIIFLDKKLVWDEAKMVQILNRKRSEVLHFRPLSVCSICINLRPILSVENFYVFFC